MKRVLLILLVLLMLTATSLLTSCFVSSNIVTTSTQPSTPIEPEVHVHDYVAIVTPSTCTEQGYTTYTCECGKSYDNNYTDALGHRYGDWETIKEATNVEDGLRERRCECGDVQQEIIEASQTEFYIQYENLKSAAYPTPNGYDSRYGLYSLPKPEADGWDFVGWYTASIGGELVDYIPEGTKKNIILYAHWEIIEYSITYDYGISNTGYIPTNSNKTTYTIEDQFSLSKPYWSGLIFINWTDENGKEITQINKGTTGNLTLTANWTTYENMVYPSNSQILDYVFDENTGVYYFIYELGSIENIVLDTNISEDAKYIKTADIEHVVTTTTSVTIEDTLAQTKSNSFAQSHSNSKTWSYTNELATGIAVGLDYEVTKSAGVEKGPLKASLETKFGISVDLEQQWAHSETTGTSSSYEETASYSMAYTKESSVSSGTETSLTDRIAAELPNGHYYRVHMGIMRAFVVITFEPKTQSYSWRTISVLDGVYSATIYYPDSTYMNKEMPAIEFEYTEEMLERIEEVYKSSYYVVYDSGSADADNMITSKHPVGTASTLLPNPYTKDGYKLVSWNTEPDGSGTDYADGATINNLAIAGGTITLYAQWEKAEYEVTFNWSGNTKTVRVPAGQAASAPLIDDVLFLKWDTDFSKVKKDMVVNAKYLAGYSKMISVTTDNKSTVITPIKFTPQTNKIVLNISVLDPKYTYSKYITTGMGALETTSVECYATIIVKQNGAIIASEASFNKKAISVVAGQEVSITIQFNKGYNPTGDYNHCSANIAYTIFSDVVNDSQDANKAFSTKSEGFTAESGTTISIVPSSNKIVINAYTLNLGRKDTLVKQQGMGAGFVYYESISATPTFTVKQNDEVIYIGSSLNSVELYVTEGQKITITLSVSYTMPSDYPTLNHNYGGYQYILGSQEALGTVNFIILY